MSSGAPSTVAGTTTLARVTAVVRLVVAGLVAAAVLATVLEAAGRTRVNPFNLFGYFTVQSNVLLAGVLAVLGVLTLARRRAPAWAVGVRAACVTYIVLVGLVYATLLAPLGAAGGVPVAWANTVLHVLTPLYAVADWLLAPDRERLRARAVALFLGYPLVWAAVVLVRGATDGWVPYPFLDPANGYGTVALYVLAIAAAVAVVGAVVVASSRLPRTRGRRDR